jgi:hypothetical protein
MTTSISRTPDEELPPTLDVVTAGRLLGIGRTLAYRLVRTGKWPTRVIRLGDSIRIPTQPVLALLEDAGEDHGGYPQIVDSRPQHRGARRTIDG